MCNEEEKVLIDKNVYDETSEIIDKLIKKCVEKYVEESIKETKELRDMSSIAFGIDATSFVEELKTKGYSIDKKQVKISNTISTLGFHNVDIELHKKVVATIKIELKK